MATFLKYRNHKKIPVYSIWTMAILVFCLILTGSLQVILEFGSITFIIVSILMAVANFKIRSKTQSNSLVAFIAILGLTMGGLCLFYYEYTTEISNLYYIFEIYTLLLILAFIYSKINHRL